MRGLTVNRKRWYPARKGFTVYRSGEDPAHEGSQSTGGERTLPMKTHSLQGMSKDTVDCVTVARSLRGRCHLQLPLADLTHCDARFFVALYEAILGEQVPDFVADSRSPEDDAHNVQSVIDSLALDYLQVSLSHITGENVVRRDPESIKNLLEIFDGLLEYLTEQISEASSQNGDDPPLRGRLAEIRGDDENLPPSLGSLSSDLRPSSCGADGSESTAELIRLGDTAHTFVLRGLDPGVLRMEVQRTQPPRPSAANHHVSAVTGGDGSPSLEERESATRPGVQEPPTAILLKRPCQQDGPRAEDRDVRVSLSSAGSSLHCPDGRGGPAAGGLRDVAHEPSVRAELQRSAASKRTASCEKVGFRSLPDVHLMTLQSDWSEGTTTREAEIRSRDPEDSLLISQAPDPRLMVDEPLSVQRARNRLSELELQEMSEKLSRRLDELDGMLKRALGGPIRSGEMKEDDKLSQHSDSIMEIRRKKRLHAPQHVKTPGARPRSLSPSPLPPPRRSVSAQFEDALNKAGRGEMGKIRRDVQKELDLERRKSRLLRQAYEGELKDLQETEKQKLAKLKAALRAEEEEYKENLQQDSPQSHPERVYGVKQVQAKPWTPDLRKPAHPMKIAENDLLPLLLEEFPHLQISHHALGAMWKGQLAQMEQLARSGQEDERSERQLQKEVEEARRKHELLVGLIQREQEHNQRLKDLKDRIHLQKSAQNRMREKRQQVARAKRYYDDYHVQLRAKLLRARTREERMVKQLFVEGLELQKQRLRQVRSYAKEQREEQRQRHKDELESMENYYKDQFSMLAEAVSQEREQLQSQDRAQSKNLHKLKRELRAKMEKEIRDLQELILRTDEDAFFRELEAERLRRRLQMASFQYSKSHGL
ncbi:centrosomal protein of 95 kDa isoform 2-T2 [Anomaloglossus baeobatrachus]